ncbi:MAG: hypothetical protein K6E33_06195 [Lachnospiraceae bacterium]|nr:hypothetical protein [Lachnospiraceae bacterium]
MISGFKKAENVGARLCLPVLIVTLAMFSMSCGQSKKVLTDGDMKATLSGHTLTIEVPGDSYETGQNVTVQDVIVADINNDNTPDVLALCVKQGSYGDHLPFYVEENDTDLDQHIFIYTYNEKRGIYPMWMSSAIPQEISRFEVRRDSERDVAVLTLISPDGTETSWYWDYFGLKAF